MCEVLLQHTLKTRGAHQLYKTPRPYKVKPLYETTHLRLHTDFLSQTLERL